MQKLALNPKTSTKEYWTFRKESNKKFTHGLHQYPARMHPEIAKKIITDYAKKKTLVIDPYLGSAGVLIEAMFHGNNSVGFDINPLAILLSRVKTTVINPQKAKEGYLAILKKSKHDFQNGRFYSSLVPDEYNVKFWHKPNVIKKLSILKHHIFKSEQNEKIVNFLKICFSHTVRSSSNQRKNEFKIFRMPYHELIRFRPDVFKLFEEICEKNCSLMDDFRNNMRGKQSKTSIMYGNAKNIFENYNKIRADFVDEAKNHLVITSPPYGDHQTTVAYGQFSYHSGLWLDLPLKKLKEVDKLSLGGQRNTDHFNDSNSSELNSVIRKIALKNNKRADDVSSFFHDFDKFLSQLPLIFKNTSYLCFVLGNRTVCGIRIPTDRILVELAKNYGIKYLTTYSRFILSKRIPFKNSPANIPNKVGETMTEERIVLFKN